MTELYLLGPSRIGDPEEQQERAVRKTWILMIVATGLTVLGIFLL